MNKLLILMLGLMVAIGLLVTGCDSATAPSGQSSAQAPVVGNQAPDFSLTDMEGETVSLSDFRGRPVLINFWATWCGPCRFEMPFLQQVHEEWLDRGLAVLAVDVGESRATVENFMQEENLSLPVLLDKDQAVATDYNIRYFPTTFLIDKNGIIQAVKIGAFAGVAEIERDLAEIMP